MKIIYLLLSVIWTTFSYANNQVLLVGTTGDYPPLTLKTASGYTGTDIQIIQDFAQAKKLSIKFISTTWPGLTQDLLNHKFDVAVGGISENPPRNKLFYLSQTITTTAKAALIRCGDQQRFKSLASIDTESVLIVENRGGTNQDFALSNIKLASILLVPRNQDALARLTNGKNLADVMFTDDVEIKYHTQINPQLCLAKIPEQFPRVNKVFLFAKTKTGCKLQMVFDQWWLSNKQRYTADN